MRGLRRTEILHARCWASDSSKATAVGKICFNWDDNYLHISKNMTVNYLFTFMLLITAGPSSHAV